MIIHADTIISRFDRDPLPDGAVVVKYGRIIALGKAAPLIRNYRGHRILRLEQAVLMPGLVNLHTHLELPPMLDNRSAKDYAEWVLMLIKAKKRLTPRDYVTAAQKNIASLIRSGTTMVADICTHGISSGALKQSGIRAIVYHEIISMTDDPLPLVRPRLGPATRLLRHGFSPHSPHTVSEVALRAIQAVSARRRIPLCMHVAETPEETNLLRRRKSGLERLYATAGWDVSRAPAGRSSFDYLRRIGVLSPTFLAVHAVQADDADIAVIRRSGAGIAHCPRSNDRLGVGTLRLRRFLDAGIPVGLGTDSLASSPTLNLWDEMRHALLVHCSSGITSRDVLWMATLGGARALHRDREIGSLEPGKFADCIAVRLPERSAGDLCSGLLRETKTCIMTMVNGRILYQQK